MASLWSIGQTRSQKASELGVMLAPAAEVEADTLSLLSKWQLPVIMLGEMA